MNKSILLALSAAFITLTASAQDWAKATIEKSPRHMEWVKVKSGKRDLNCFIAYPEIKDKATTVIVIHEIFGLTDWVRSVTDQLAKEGYIAIAPDLLTGSAPGGGGTSDLPGDDAVRKAIFALPPEQITGDLNAVAKYVSELPSANGKIVVAGFCWGGTQTFRYATNNKDLKGAFVFYGSGPESSKDIARIACPVYGFYAENDNRIDATIPKTKELMKAADKTYEPVIYDGAGHGFMRAGQAPDASTANKAAREAAWKRWLDALKKY
jgi:carboxymethylenebutenolidase